MSLVAEERAERQSPIDLTAELPKTFDASDRQMALKTGMILAYCVDNGYFDNTKANKVLDFGAGAGVPTWALARLAGEGSEVTAVEQDEAKAQQIVRRRILDPEHVRVGDGIGYLGLASARGSNFDLITFFSPWPDPEARFLATFVGTARSALSQSGIVLINTAYRTAEAVQRICDEGSMQYATIPSATVRLQDDAAPISTYDTFLISK